MKKKILLIDNYDSFTFNLVQYFQILGARVVVRRNDEISADAAEKLAPNFLVFSPGPGSVEIPADIGASAEIFEKFRGKIPILGVCLGHQLIGKIFGGKIKKVPPVHGKRWPIKILNHNSIFKNLEKKIRGMRYHSMIVARENFPSNLKITAETDDADKFVMAAENLREKIFGIQFHPESIGTPVGIEILRNFLAQKI